MRNVKASLLKQIPYISHIPTDGRTVFLQPYYNEEKNAFDLYHPVGDKLHILWSHPTEMCYWSPKLVNPKNDLYIEFFDTLAKHYTVPYILNEMIRIETDIMNCCTVVGKYFLHLNAFLETKSQAISNMVKTDLEYYFGNVRSLYDLIQSIVQHLWYIEKKIKLPDSFDKMVNKSKNDLKEKYLLSDSLIKYYDDTRELFSFCRKVRNSIHHTGRDIQVVFCMEDGFGLTKGSNILADVPFADKIWPEEYVKKNNIVSVLAFYSYLNLRMLDNMSKLSHAILKAIKPMPTISNNCYLYYRGYYLHHLVNAQHYLDRQWMKPDEVKIFEDSDPEETV